MSYSYAIGIMLGLLIGSFLNVLILRYATGHSAWRGRSRCLACDHQLLGWELIPVLSYFILRGRCSHCQRPINWQYPLVEFVTALGTVLLVSQISSPLAMAASLVLFWTALVIIVIDLRQMLIPDRATIVLFLAAMVFHVADRNHFSDLPRLILGALVMGGVPLTIVLLSRGRGMGWGDVKLGAVLGFWLGFPLAVVGLLASIWVGALIGGFLVLTRIRSLRDPIPFGPFLIAGAFLGMLWGQQLIDWYLGYGGF